MIKFLLVYGLFTMNTFAQNSVRFGEVVKSGDGRIVATSQIEALEYCSKQGGRLPTIREYAQFATKYGAQFKENKNITLPGSVCEPYYQHVKGQDLDGKTDQFYFRNYEYRAPSYTNEWHWCYWSQSLEIASEKRRAYYFDYANGYISARYSGNFYPYDPCAIRCAFDN